MAYKLIRAALIILYVVLCHLFQPISYGVVQLHCSEALAMMFYRNQ